MLMFVLEAYSSEKNGVEERHYGSGPYILVRPANSALGHFRGNHVKKCVQVGFSDQNEAQKL